MVTIGKPPAFWLCSLAWQPLPSTTAAKEHNTHLIRVCVIWCYNDLELVVGGAVDKGDVVLVFIGEHTLFGCEVFDGLAWRFD